MAKLVAQKRRGRALKVKKDIGKDVEMTADSKQEEKEEATGHALFKQQAAEWREMKTKVASLKDKRKRLGKKERDQKKQLSKEIKTMLAETSARHQAELKAAGIVGHSIKDTMAISDDDE